MTSSGGVEQDRMLEKKELLRIESSGELWWPTFVAKPALDDEDDILTIGLDFGKFD